MTQDRKAKGEDSAQEMLYLQQRRAVNNAYGSLVGAALADTFAAFTFEEAADEQIERIEGASTATHPNLLDRTEGIRQNLKQAVKEIKKVAPEKFLDVDTTEAVNTPEEDPLSEEELYRQRLQQFNG